MYITTALLSKEQEMTLCLLQIVKGGADKSYGVQVTKTCKVRCRDQSSKRDHRKLEEHDLTSGRRISCHMEAQQLSFFREASRPTLGTSIYGRTKRKDLS